MEQISNQDQDSFGSAPARAEADSSVDSEALLPPPRGASADWDELMTGQSVEFMVNVDPSANGRRGRATPEELEKHP